MKKDATDNWEMRKEYDFSNARPNKYAKKYAEGTNIVVIEPDLVEFFPDSESVNATLRTLVSIFPKIRLIRKAEERLDSDRWVMEQKARASPKIRLQPSIVISKFLSKELSKRA